MARKPVSYLAGSTIIGAVVGVVVGVLTAPKSGKDTRKMMKNRALDVSKQVPQQLMSLPGRGREAIRRAPGWLKRRERVNDLPDAPDPQEAEAPDR